VQAKWLRAHVVSFVQDEKKLDRGMIKTAYDDFDKAMGTAGTAGAAQPAK
jgi:hypothetical protein